MSRAARAPSSAPWAYAALFMAFFALAGTFIAMAGRLQQAGVSRAVYFLVLVPAGLGAAAFLDRMLHATRAEWVTKVQRAPGSSVLVVVLFDGRIGHQGISPSQKTEGTFLDRHTMQLTTPTGQLRLARIVVGKVVNQDGTAVSGAQVLIGGAQAETVQDGSFDLGGGAPVPYDAIVVADVDGKQVTMEYMGLTRGDPTLMVFQPLPPDAAIDPSAPTLQSPEDPPETPVDPNTEFKWTAFAGGVHMLNIVPLDSGSEVHVVTGTGTTSAQIPDLGDLGKTALSATTEYRWFVDGFGPFEGIDDAVGPSGLVPPGGGLPIPSAARAFTTPPPP